ncbi:uncharacterized protein LOC127440724 [Myxocyprinus asiaticus]|uniref:uncharacterized protein LOC127440724 n=1 Tax=Myxocyprinus asiaticus TaxID=70543 RepID=UPI0022220D67|nr:uncharacterized protein LOC127440724 [Myxocyprinus asiaticus]
MEQEVSNFKSIRAKFQEEIQARNRPLVPEKPKRPPTASEGRSGPLSTMSSSSAVDTKTPSLAHVIFRNGEDQKAPLGKHPVSFPSFPYTTHELHRSGDGGNRQSLKVRHLPLVLPFSNELKHDSATSSSKGITSPLKCIKKPMPAPFKPTIISMFSKEIGRNGGEHMKRSNFQGVESTIKAVNTEAGEIHQARVSDPGSSSHSPEHPSSSSPSESLTDSSPGSVTQFFDQHVLSTLEKAKRKLSHKNLLMCGRPKGFYYSKFIVPSESPPSSTESENPETVLPFQPGYSIYGVPVYASTSPLKINGASRSAIIGMELNGVTQPERECSRARKPLPDLTSLGPQPIKPNRPPLVDLSRYKTRAHVIDSSETLPVEFVPESEIFAVSNAPLQNTTVPPPEFPDFDIPVPGDTVSSAINIAALELEATEFPESDSLPPFPVPDEDSSLDFQAVVIRSKEGLAGSVESSRSVEIMTSLQSVVPPEPVTSEVQMNGSHTAFNLSTEHQLPSEPTSQPGHLHESCDNVYEDVETVPKFPFSQNSKKRKGPPKNPYVDSSHVKEETRRHIWHVTQWSSVTEDQNGQTQHDRKEQQSPDLHDEKEQKKKEKHRLEREKKEQKEKEKKRNEMQKKFKITGLEEPMYHARVLVASKLRKHDLPVKSGDVISIIRTINCPKGKWLARDANNKYGYISVMNVELNIKEMLELGKRVSQAAGRGQTDGDNISFSSRSSHQNPIFTSSFTDDSEEWTCDEETLSPSADNLSQNRAVSMPDMFYSNSSAHYTVSDGSIEDVHTQHEALQKLAVFFQNTNEHITENESSLPNTDDPSFLSAVDEPPYLEAEDFQFADIDLLPPPELYADSL